jgi:hypothetical protein
MAVHEFASATKRYGCAAAAAMQALIASTRTKTAGIVKSFKIHLP